jgi:DNA-binding transcriptional regulator YiaG
MKQLKPLEKSNTKPANIYGAGRLLTGPQIKMARAALGWSAHDLAAKTGLSYGAVQKAESAPGIPSMLAKNLLAIKSALEKGGCRFIDAGDYSGKGGPGVRLK